MRKLFLIFIFSFIFSPFIFAQDIADGYELSNQVESFLIANGFSPDREILTFTGRDAFPYNISLTINGKIEQRQNLRNTIIIDFLQKDAIKYQKKILNLIENIKNDNVTVIFVFTTLDSNLFIDDVQTLGTEIYASSYQERENSCAVSISFNKDNSNVISTGSPFIISPLWLSKSIIRSFEATNNSFKMDHVLMSLYRMGLIKSDARLASYLENSIPSIALSLQDENSLDALKYFINSFDVEETSQWDNHYLYLYLPFASIWLGEKVFIVTLMIIAAIVLFIIVFFSFTGKTKQQEKNIFKSKWYMLPLTLIVSFLSLYVGQFFAWIFANIGVESALVLFGIKIIISILIISALFAYSEHKNLNIDAFIFSYIHILIAILNIFIFSTVDLLLLFVFCVEYIIIFLSKSTNKTKNLIISLILMFLPFCPYIYVLIVYGNLQGLNDFSASSFSINLLLTMGLFPFQIMWFRLLETITFHQKKLLHSSKKRILNIAFKTLTLVSISITIIVITSIILSPNKENTPQWNFIFSTENNLKITSTPQNTNNLLNYRVTVSSDTAPLRYNVTVTSNTAVPIFDSLYDYKISEERGNASFLIPDFPPKKINLTFASEEKDELIMHVTAWYKGENNTIKIETTQKNLAGRSNE